MESGQAIFRYLTNAKHLMAKSSSAMEKGLKFYAVVGNTGCDPDSIVGSLLTSFIHTLQINSKHPTFTKDFDMMFSSDPDLELLILHRFKPVLPLVNSVNKDIIKSKRDLGYLNSAFRLGIDEMMTLGEMQALTGCKHEVDLTLFDFNYPNDLVKKFLSDSKGRVTTVIDHHSIADQAFIDKLDKTMIEDSASCVSVVLQQFRKQSGFGDSTVMQKLSSYMPELIKASCCVIDFDSFQFAIKEKNVRWWQKDQDLLIDLQALVGFTDAAKQADLNRMMAAQYSEEQFQSSLDQLLTLDSKSYDYDVNYPDSKFNKSDKASIFYSVLPNTMEGYINAFGVTEIKECMAKYMTDRSKAVALMFMYVDLDYPSKCQKKVAIHCDDESFFDRIVAAIDRDQYPIAVVKNDKSFDDQKHDFAVHTIDSLSCNLSRKVLEKVIRSVV